MIKEWIKEKFGLNVSSLYIGQVKDLCGLPKERDMNNYGVHRVPQCPPDKIEAIKAAFKYYGMID